MRAEAGIVLLSLGLWAAGASVLLACGIVSLERRSLLVWSGAAYLVGSAVVGVVLTIAMIAGIGLSTPATAAVLVLVVAGGLAVWRLKRPEPAAPRRAFDGDRGFRIAASVLFAVFLFVGTGVALVQPISNWDGWAIWGVKSLILYDHGTIPEEFASGAYYLSHVDYPMFWPVFEAVHYRVMGGPEAKLATFPHWLVYVSFAGTIAAVGARLTRPAIWALAAVGTLTSYAVLDQVFWHYADVPTAVMAGAGALFGGLWVAGHGARWLVPAAVLLAATANGKNEGLMAAVAILAALGVGALLARGRPRARTLLTAVGCGAFVGLAALPWRLWVSSHDVAGEDIEPADALDPGYLADASGRVEPAANSMWIHLTDPHAWGYLVFAGLVLIAVAVARRSTRAIGAYYGVAAGLIYLFLVVAYWVANTDLNWHLRTSSDRVVMLVGFVGVAALLHLSAALYEDDAEVEA